MKKKQIYYFRQIFKYVKPYWHLELSSIFFTIIFSIVSIKTNLLIKNLIDDALIPKNLTKLIYFCLLFVILSFLSVTISLIIQYFLARISQNIVSDIRVDFFKHIIKLPYNFFIETSTGEVISRIIYDTENIQEALSGAFIRCINSLITIIVILICLFIVDWKLTLIIIPIIPIFIFIFFLIRKNINIISKKTQCQLGKVTKIIDEDMEGIMEIKCYTMENSIIKNFSNHVRKLAKITVKKIMSIHMSNLVWKSILFPYQAVIIGVGGTWYITKGNPSIGTLFAYINFINILIQPSIELMNSITQFFQSSASFERIFQYFSFKQEISGDIKLHNIKGKIIFKNVYLSIGNKDILKNINLDIKPKTVNLIVGKTGSGKTSLIKTLLKIYNISQGKIEIDNIDLKDVDLNSLRQNISFISQDSFLFNTTIKENLLLTNSNATMEKIIESCKKAQIHDLISSLEEGYETIVGKRGTKLSGGERQRILIARALLKDSKIIIMDEPTSNLDNITENNLWKMINEILRDKTVLIISHRFSKELKVDKTIVIDNGQIIEENCNDKFLIEV